MLSNDLLERQLLDALPVSIYTLDADGHVVSSHQAAARFGDDGGASSLLEEKGAPIWEAIPHGVSRGQVELGMRMLRAGRAPVARWEINRAPDDDHVALVQMTPLRDDAHAAAVAEADDPERAVQSYDGSRLGRAGHKLQVSLGTIGEAFDSRAAKRRS